MNEKNIVDIVEEFFNNDMVPARKLIIQSKDKDLINKYHKTINKKRIWTYDIISLQ